jgi:ribonuclease J
MSDAIPRLRIVPLGGLGEVGMNCLALEHADQILIIDCGTGFPQDDYGIDIIHPRFDWLVANAARIVGLCITHGHEDHIGAVSYLLQRVPMPIWAPRHARVLLERRLTELRMTGAVDTLYELPRGRRTAIGGFEVEPIRMSHSIVDATSLSIRTAAGHVVHSGDFKFDPAPSDGEPTDEERLLELGIEGVDLLLSDSTNVDSFGTAGSEADVEVALEQAIRAATGRVVVTMFASNVQRLISLGRIAQRRGRRICLLGRSLAFHVEVATALGYLDWPPTLIIPNERVRTYPRGEILILASGTQAEPGSAMARLAEGSHRTLDLQADDTVIFSSRVIPGNERPVSAMTDALLRRGLRVVGKETRGVHTSGHANRDEQRLLIDLLQPRCFVPVHGTLHHLRRHEQLAKEAGVLTTAVIENGQTLWLQAGTLQRGVSVPAGYVNVGPGGVVVGDDTLKTRRDLGRYGVITIGVVSDSRGKFQGLPSVATSGLEQFDQTPELKRELAEHLARAGGRAGSPELLEAELQRVARSWLERHHALRPLVLVQALSAPA